MKDKLTYDKFIQLKNEITEQTKRSLKKPKKEMPLILSKNIYRKYKKHISPNQLVLIAGTNKLYRNNKRVK